MARVSMIDGATGGGRAAQRSGERRPMTNRRQLLEIGRILALSVVSPQTLVAEERSWSRHDRPRRAVNNQPEWKMKANTPAWRMSW